MVKPLCTDTTFINIKTAMSSRYHLKGNSKILKNSFQRRIIFLSQKVQKNISVRLLLGVEDTADVQQ